MNTRDIEVKLAQYFEWQKNVICPCIKYSGQWLFHECDLLVINNNGYATEIEIKVTKADLLAERYKSHKHQNEKIKYFYFAIDGDNIPKDFALQNIPNEAGLFVLRTRKDWPMIGMNGIIVDKERSALARKGCLPLTTQEINAVERVLAMRYWNLRRDMRNELQESEG